MAVKTYDRFWNDRDGKEYGLIGQSTTNDAKGVALQVDEATGELLVRVPSTSPVTVEQSDPTKLKCEPTQTDQTKLVVTARGGGAVELATDAHAVNIKDAVETMAGWDAVHDSPAGTDGVRLMGTAYADPSVLPADVSGDADDVRVACNHKGVLYTYEAYLSFAEDATRGVLRVERQGTESGRKVISTQLVAPGTAGRTYGAVVDGGVAGITVNLRADGVIGGAIIHVLQAGINETKPFDLQDWPYANGLYGEIAAGGGGFNVHYRNT